MTDRVRLKAIVRDRNSPQKHVWHARIVLLTADGQGTNAITCAIGKDKTVVWRWQERFMHKGVAGLTRDKTCPSRIPPLPAASVDGVVALSNQAPLLGLEEARVDRRAGQAIVLHYFGQHQSFLRVPGGKCSRTAASISGRASVLASSASTKARSSSDSLASGNLISSAMARRAARGSAKVSSRNGSGSRKGLHGDRGRGGDLDHTILAGYHRARQHQLVG